MLKIYAALSLKGILAKHVSFLLILCQLGVMIGCRHGYCELELSAVGAPVALIAGSGGGCGDCCA